LTFRLSGRIISFGPKRVSSLSKKASSSTVKVKNSPVDKSQQATAKEVPKELNAKR